MQYDRTTKRCSAIIAISLNGEKPKPSLILTRITIDSEIYTFLPRNSFYQFYQPNGFITTTIFFLKWWEQIFIPHLPLKSQKFNFYGTANVIADGLRAHHAILNVIVKPTDKIKLIYIPPHSLNQTQALDFRVFGHQKRISRF